MRGGKLRLKRPDHSCSGNFPQSVWIENGNFWKSTTHSTTILVSLVKLFVNAKRLKWRIQEEAGWDWAEKLAIWVGNDDYSEDGSVA